MGMSLRPLDEACQPARVWSTASLRTNYYEPPLINVIKFACNACPEKVIKVTAMCQGCLAHLPRRSARSTPSASATARATLTRASASSVAAASTAALTAPSSRPSALRRGRGMGAIHSDEHGRAEIDYDKCVSCGICLVNCPFGAIVDKGPDLPADPVHQAR